MRDPLPCEEAVHSADANPGAALDQPRLDFDQGDVASLGDQPLDEVAGCFDPARVAVTTARFGQRFAMLDAERDAPPADRA